MQKDWGQSSQPAPEVTPAQKDIEQVGSELTAARDEMETIRAKLEKVRALKVAELQKTRDVVIDPKRVASVLQPLLRHADPAVRRAAVEAAGDLGSPLLVFSLIQRLNDPVGGIRHVALATLRAITGQRVVDRLPEDESARKVLLRTLRRCWTESGALKLRLKQG